MKVERLKDLLSFCDPDDDVCVEGPEFDLEITGVQWSKDDALLLLMIDIDYEGPDDDEVEEEEPIEGTCCDIGGRTDPPAEEVGSQSRIKQL